MKITSTQMTLAEYCGQMENKTIVVNRDYQRSPKRWPSAARSFLIDTILQGYPIPKVILAQRTNLVTKKTTKEIVDGQQRSMAVYDYFKNQYAIVGDSPFGGARFNNLPEEAQQAFLDYSIGTDIFTGAVDADIRQTFRRMNSYTVPLNPQEQRYATHQGQFKWFIFDQSNRYGEAFKKLGVLREKQISAMQDGLLLTEICESLVSGIQTAQKRRLDKFYTERDDVFTEQEDLTLRLSLGFDAILRMPDLHDGVLMKPFQFYTLMLACIHMALPVDALQSSYPLTETPNIDWDLASTQLGSLALALETDSPASSLGDFVAASSSATNTLRNRALRFATFCMAIHGNPVA
jgi:hypothetical protein